MIMNAVFPFIINVEYRLLARFCLASLIYHILLQKLGAQSPMRSNTLMTNLIRCDPQYIVIKYAHEESGLVFKFQRMLLFSQIRKK